MNKANECEECGKRDSADNFFLLETNNKVKTMFGTTYAKKVICKDCMNKKSK